MKTRMHWLALGLLVAMATPEPMSAQDAPPRPEFIVMQTNHFNFANEDGSRAEWLALEKEFHDKVTMKNEHVTGAGALSHFYTEDNSEFIRVAVYMDWDAIEKAQQRNQELIEAAWPDEDERRAFFAKRSKYYTGNHSDEIYRTRDGAKFSPEESEPPEEPMIIYMQKSQTTWPEGGRMDVFTALDVEYHQAVTHKNDLIKGYYPMRHGWGAKSDEVIDIFVYMSLADMEKAGEKTGELVQAHWSDEATRDKFFEQYNGYFTGWHADYLYMTVPELDK